MDDGDNARNNVSFEVFTNNAGWIWVEKLTDVEWKH